MSLLRPDLCIKGIMDIPFADLERRGIKGLIFDLDNTLIPWRQYEENPALTAWFAAIQQQGFAVCILSNSRYCQVEPVGQWLGVAVVCGGKKPGREGFRRALTLLQLPPEQVAMVGDQVFTDIYGGNRIGLYTILTEVITVREHWGTRYVSRRAEKLVKKNW
ncbi:MAG: YqeG family HAD IIIA-type phosphatase [Clostridiales bacterium]